MRVCIRVEALLTPVIGIRASAMSFSPMEFEALICLGQLIEKKNLGGFMSASSKGLVPRASVAMG